MEATSLLFPPPWQKVVVVVLLHSVGCEGMSIM